MPVLALLPVLIAPARAAPPLCPGGCPAALAGVPGPPEAGLAVPLGAADPGVAPLPAEPVRVDVPDWPGALISSDRGSMLAAPPEDPDVAWRPEPLPAPDIEEAPAEDTGIPGGIEGALAGGADTGGVGPMVASEALGALAARPWQEAGWTGEGVKVAIFDSQWYGAELLADELAGPDGAFPETHDCYAHRSCGEPIDTLRPTWSWETGSHGVACAEVLRDVAPGAELHLVRVNGLTTLENAVDWAVREDVDLVSMSLSFFNQAFYDGTGAVAAAMDPLADAGVLMVTSAGNYAGRHYAGELVDRDGDGFHEFPWGSEYLPIWFGAGTSRINLLWDDFHDCGATDLDAYVYDAGGAVIGRSTDAQDPDARSCAPVERVTVHVAEEGWTWLAIHRRRGDSADRFDVMAFGGTPWRTVPEGSVTDPGTHPSVLTVGAVRAGLDGADYLFHDAESFSSRGPTHAGLPKPDLAGPDGLSTETYGPLGFYGTSASTPAVAGALALVLGARPDLDPAGAAELLRASALSDAAVGAAPDTSLGAGRARLPAPGAVGGRGCVGFGHALLLVFPFALRRRRGQDRNDAARP